SIYPNILEGRGLASALRAAASNAGVAAVVDVPAVADYPPEIVTALFWTWSEALTSASTGSAASIEIADADGGLTFDISTTGLHPEGRIDRLRDRIHALDGRVAVEAPRSGVSRVHGWVPISR